MSADESIKPTNLIRFALLLFLLLALSHAVHAERLPIKTYTTSDGLAQDNVNRILRDSRGFLWFCTSEGLSRFDGYRFTNYTTDQGLPKRQVNDLLETRSGVYWVATLGGLCRFNPDAPPQSNSDPAAGREPRFVVYRLGEDEASQYINALCEDQAGTIWCGTMGGLYRLDPDNNQLKISFVDFHERATDNDSPGVISIIQDRSGALWISTGHGLYRHRLDGVIERYAVPEGVPVRNFTPTPLLQDHDGHIWLGTNVGLYKLASEPQPNRSIVERVYTTKNGLTGDSVSWLFESSDGRLWVGTWNALSEFVPESNNDKQQFRQYSAANGISDVATLGEDLDGNLWIGTESHGAVKITRSGFVTYDEADGLRATRISQISEDRAGEICVFGTASIKGTVNRWDGKRFTAVTLTLPKGVTKWSWGWYQNMLQDEQGEWWMGSGEGLVRYPQLSRLEQLTSAPAKAIYNTGMGLGGNLVFRVFEDARGDIWVGTLGIGQDGLSRWERRTGTIHRYSSDDGLPDPKDGKVSAAAPTAFCEDRFGNLWVGFYGGGVARYYEGHFTLFTKKEGMPDGFVRALYSDHAGRLWVAAADGGVARIDDPGADRPRFVTYTTADGLSSNHATCVTEDQWGRIYIGTVRGVDQLDPATGRIKHYTTAEGLANNNVNVSFCDRSGALWFGTPDGLSKLTPQPARPQLPPPVFVSGLRIAGGAKTISELGETNLLGLRLEANKNRLQIDFFGISFAPGEALRYQYKLEGTDQDWSAPTEQRSVNYENLAPGSYRFLVRAINAEGVVSLSPAGVSFTILPPFWKRWWFITIVAALIAILTYSLYRYRVARLIELERVRTRIATDLHDDIGSSLSQVSVLSEVIRQRIGRDPQVSEPLSMIANLSRDLVDSMNDIVWAINPRRDHLSDLTQRMRRFVSDVFTARDIDFEFLAPDPHQDMKLGADIRREVFLIFKESINNMVRHSACTEAHIEFLIENGWLELKMRDNGKGFDPDRDSDGNGLSSMRQRAIKIHGSIEIHSGNDRGTLVNLRVPLGSQRWRRK